MTSFSSRGVVGVVWPWKAVPMWVENRDVISQAIRDVILTASGERKMSVDYGSETMSVVFENRGVLLEGLARRTISMALAVHLPEVRVLNIDVSDAVKDTDPVTVTVDYLYIGERGGVVVDIDAAI